MKILIAEDEELLAKVFEEKFKNVCVLKNRGADLAPWNIERDKIHKKNGVIFP